MADDPKFPFQQPNPAASSNPAGSSDHANSTTTRPASNPTGPAPGSPTGPSTQTDNPQTPPSAAGPPADALSDGTAPTVLKTGATPRTVPKSKASITTIYRKADVMTTLLTFVGAVVAGAIILGVYAYFTRSKAPTTKPQKVTTLDKAELDKLDAFFNGNSAGKSAEVLTISSSSLFKNRVAIGSDLKVVGGLQVSATTALADLTVDKTSTLGVTNVRGALTVSGPVNLQSPAILGAGATVNGNLAVSGNGTYGGSLAAGTINVRDLTVSGTFNLNGHLNIGGQQPSAAPDSAAGTSASANVSGNDAAGTVSVNTGTVTPNANLGGSLVKVTFKNHYSTTPTVVVTPNGRSSALLQPYIIKTADWFIVGTTFDASSHTTYSFDYWIVQ